MSLDQANSGNLIWKIAGGLVVIVALAGTWIWMNAEDPVQSNTTATTTTPIHATATPQPVEAESASTVVDNTSNHATNSDISAVDEKALVNESILNEQIPAHSALAKEEIAKLDDIQAQLADQQKNLEAQQADADQLIELKQEQIKLLEQQLSAQN
ncbi:restriction endonuclease subunit S domain-containing protein [Acinetobacter lanii]|uniref:Uncharacterized protein n=1 Tax=Acinetobacter lanii TaxID=2715163 RepID=A0A6G8S157_9GAMM|nr:hypothetical protein [Acinetobacter lanii]QIO07929.1 hypothetical protein G8D99_02035 [Acinetobacter lanii]